MTTRRRTGGRDARQKELNLGAGGDELDTDVDTAAEDRADAPDGRHPHTSGPLGRMMDRNFLEYASYVICERAIPDLADGLKPVQRRILHALYEKDDGRFIKVANVVGHTMQYHPHGDASIGDALVTLVNKGYLIEGQGNFGNLLTGNEAAAPRYIECRLTELARREVFHPALTAYTPSYDGRNREPVAFPTKLPLLLMLGAEGIAVGLATRILPHNFTELLQAQVAILTGKPFQLYPDFQQGGLLDPTGLQDGNGTARVRAVIDGSEPGRLVVRELPPGQTTESLIAGIEDGIRKHGIAVKSISDFTAEQVEIELTLAAGADPEAVTKALFAYTACEATVSSHIVVIHDGKPREMTVPEVLRENTRRLVETLRRELEHRRGELGEDIHSRTLVEIFVEERLYKRIEECRTAQAVQQAVFDGFKPFAKRLRRPITPEDVEMLLGIRIRRISRFDLEKNRKDIERLLDELATVEKHLRDVRAYAATYLRGLLKTYGKAYPRRTAITRFDQVDVEELAAGEFQVAYDRENGYLGHGTQGDPLFSCSRFDKLILVWKDGRYRVVKPPEKLFVDKTLVYAAVFDRDREMTVVFEHDPFVYLKRFTFGGAILDKDYACTPQPATILHIQEGTPEQLYLKFKPAKRQRIGQQRIRPADTPVKGVRSNGNHLTAKRVDRLATEKPRWWKDDA